MSFLAPAFLLLLIAAPLPWAWRGARREPVQALLRSLSLAALALALARPAWVDGAGGGSLVFVLDRSASVPDSEQRRAVAAVEATRAELPRGVGSVLVEWGGAEPLVDGLHDRHLVLAEAGDSPLGQALALAARALPDGEAGAVVLASDGAAGAADWGEAAAELSARGVPVHVLPLRADAEELRVVGFEAEDELRQGHPARLRAVLAGGPGAVRLSLHRSGEAEALAELPAVRVDGRAEAVVVFEPGEAGFLELELRIEALEGSDQRPQDNFLARSFAVQEPLEVLYLGERTLGGAEALSRLAGPGFRFERAADLDDADPAAYPLVVLDDRSAASVPRDFQQRLTAAVAGGGAGLLMSGGAAFGPGGWADTPVAELLPVELVQKEEKRDPSTTLCVIIDTSGSMGGNRVQLAKEVARLAIRRLLPHDKVGIVEFYGAKRWAAPIQPASNLIELERALNRLDAGGGTVILPAIEEAFYGMQNVQTRYKHVLVLTDGGVETGPFESMMRRMADKGMNVSTVLIGPETHSEFLVSLANWGKGRFYNVPDRFNLPEVILKQPASAKLPSYRPGSHAVRGRGSAAWWAGTDPESLPELAGYVETRARPGAEVLIETVDGAHPVLASWRYGLGRVSALTTEPAGEGTQPWRDWQGFGALVAQVLARTASSGDGPFLWSVERRGAEVVLRAERRRPGAELPEVRLLDPAADGPAPPVFRERAPGLFEARLAQDPGRELRALAGARGTEPRYRLCSPARADRSAELQVDPLAELSLPTLAAATGGSRLAGPSGALGMSGGRALRLRELAPVLLLLSLLIYFGELVWRRRPASRGGSV